MDKKFCDECKKEINTIKGDHFGLFIGSKNEYIEGQPYADCNDYDFCSLECLKKFVNKVGEHI